MDLCEVGDITVIFLRILEMEKTIKKSILDQKQSAYYITDSVIVFRFTLESGSIFIMNYYPEPDLSLA